MTEFSEETAVRILDEQFSILKGLKLLMINIEDGIASQDHQTLKKWQEKKEELLNLLESKKNDFAPVLKSWGELELDVRRGFLRGKIGTVLDSIEQISVEIQSNAKGIDKPDSDDDSDGDVDISDRINLFR